MKIKKCIWCSKNYPQVKFENEAHTIPKTLGGKNICDAVCDSCNSYFGNMQNRLPSIETVLKESFNVSRLIYLHTEDEVGKNRALPKFSSVFFKLDLRKKKISIKSAYKIRRGFQVNVGRLLRRGIFKIFLEERQRQYGDAHLPKYNFIREFARYDLGDFPVYYFKRKYGIVATSTEYSKSPELFMKEGFKMKYLIEDYSFFEFELLGHVLSIPTSRQFHLTSDVYKQKTYLTKKELFTGFHSIKKFTDFDFMLNVLDD
jgi:hypothetical protein